MINVRGGEIKKWYTARRKAAIPGIGVGIAQTGQQRTMMNKIPSQQLVN